MTIAAQTKVPVPVRLRIDFVSDVVCPWCAIGLHALEQALARLDGKVEADIHFQPFELNPQLSREGEDIAEHLQKKYGASPEQAARNRENIRARGAELGFEFRMDKRDRIYNTFDAHRLLYWAGLEGRQAALKHALLSAYFGNGENISSHAVLRRIAGEVGLSTQRADEILASAVYATEVRARERFYADHGINGVPAVIVNERHLITGGQPVEAFEGALKQIAGVS